MCTRIFWTDNGQANVVARTLDYSHESQAVVRWCPAGLVHAEGAGRVGWTSTYASLVVLELDRVAVEGFNEAGLGAHALMDTEASYPPLRGDRPRLRNTDWVSYVLDNFATVAEAVEAHRNLQIEPVALELPTPQGPAEVVVGMHLIIEDDSGATAVFEFVDGQLVIAQGRDIPVVANAPALPAQLANLARYRPFGGELPPPGDITSLDRFVRASYALHYLPQPTSVAQTVAYVSQAIMQAAKSPGIPYPDGSDYPTRWITVDDLTNRVLYFWDRESPSAVWVRLDGLVAQGQGQLRELSLRREGLAGDVTEELADASAAPDGG